MGLIRDAAVLGMGEQFRVLADDLVPGVSDHLAKGVVDFQDLVLGIDEDRANHVVLEREAKALLTIRGGIEVSRLGLDLSSLGLGGGVVCCLRSAVGVYHRRSLTTDADGTVARPPRRLLVSLRVPREHVGFE